MTVTYNTAETASCIATFIDTTTLTLPLDPATGSAALFRFQIPSTNTYFIYPLYLNITIGGTFVGPTETFNVVMLKDPIPPTLGIGITLDPDEVPSAIVALATGEYHALGSVTLSAYASVAIELDLAMVTEIMASSTSYTDPWAGSLLFWVYGAQSNPLCGASRTATLTAYDTIDYANRDTGTPGLKSSRWDRCPVTGLKIPRGEMVMDGYRKILVHPKGWDPEEPEALDWGPESNEENNENL